LKKEKRCKYNILNKIAENFPNLKKKMPLGYRKSPEHQRELTKIEPICSILSVKQPAQRTDKEY
jgi:hypothetical protein